MSNALTTFSFNANQLRTITDDTGNPWFVLADVCAVLELSNPSMVASRLDEDERAKFNLGRQGEATIISESGLYAVILRSDKPEAKPFRKWVTGEVLPAIRKTGGYVKPGSEMKFLAAYAADVAKLSIAMDRIHPSMLKDVEKKAAELGVDISAFAKQQITAQEAREADVIKYLTKRGAMTVRDFQGARTKSKPWALIQPKSAIGQAMRETFAELEQKGVIARNGNSITLNTIH